MRGAPKRRARRRRGNRFLTGLALGLAVAVLVHVYHRARPPPAPPPAPTQAARDDRRFDFYKMLPEFAVDVPAFEGQLGAAPDADEATDETAAQEPPAGATHAPGARYTLQLGAYRAADLQRLRALLGDLWRDARLEKVQLETGAWTRVEVGPYDSLPNANALRRRLKSLGIDSLLVHRAAAPAASAKTE